MRTPTLKQMALLSQLPVGHAVLNPRRNDWRPLLNHGWVEAVWPEEWKTSGLAYNSWSGGPYLPSLRITPDGLRALAAAVEKHGQPPVPARPLTQVEAMSRAAERRAVA